MRPLPGPTGARLARRAPAIAILTVAASAAAGFLAAPAAAHVEPGAPAAGMSSSANSPPAPRVSAAPRGRLYTVTLYYRYHHSWDFEQKGPGGGACISENHYVGFGAWTETYEKTYTVRVRIGRTLRTQVINPVEVTKDISGSMTLTKKIEGPETEPDCSPRTDTEDVPSPCGSVHGPFGTLEIVKKRSERGRILHGLLGSSVVVPKGPCFMPVDSDHDRNLKNLGYSRIPLRKLVRRPQSYDVGDTNRWQELIGADTGGWPYPTNFSQQWRISFVPKSKRG